MANRNLAEDTGTHRTLRCSAACLALGVLGLAYGGVVQANCLDINLATTRSGNGPPRLIPTAYHSEESGSSTEDAAAIVGLWKFEWRAKGNAGIPDGALLDFGTVLWHEDGTEVTVSGGRTPAVGDVCMGAWRQVGHSTFRLTHLAMGYGPPQGPPSGYGGLTTLQMQVTVDSDDDTYHGWFTLTQYQLKFDPTVPWSEFDQSETAFVLTGTVTGKRVSPK
jgi:hypothetical protein